MERQRIDNKELRDYNRTIFYDFITDALTLKDNWGQVIAGMDLSFIELSEKDIECIENISAVFVLFDKYMKELRYSIKQAAKKDI